MYKAVYLSPMVPSYHVSETRKFFVELFGFSVLMEGDYSMMFVGQVI